MTALGAIGPELHITHACDGQRQTFFGQKVSIASLIAFRIASMHRVAEVMHNINIGLEEENRRDYNIIGFTINSLLVPALGAFLVAILLF